MLISNDSGGLLILVGLIEVAYSQKTVLGTSFFCPLKIGPGDAASPLTCARTVDKPFAGHVIVRRAQPIPGTYSQFFHRDENPLGPTR
jgi:hypothetical protein